MKTRTDHTPTKGDLLIARPYLGEPFFNHAVVLLLDVESDSTVMGLSLNISTDLKLSDLLPAWPGGEKVDVYCGGPCENDRLFMLHTLGDRFEGSIPVAPGIYLGGNLEDVVEYVESGGQVEGKMRFFVGYAGWEGDQLRQELEENTWAVAAPAKEDITLRGEGIPYWRRALDALGKLYRPWLILPVEHELN